jgi:hypothetical protein
MISFINHTVRDELKTIKHVIFKNDNNYYSITKLVDKLCQDSLYSYKYGSNWIEEYITNYRINKLNKFISKKYKIVIF